jgi:WD40 repeat protein
LKVWDVTTGQERLGLKADNGMFYWAAYSPDGAHLAVTHGQVSSGWTDIKLLDPTTGEVKQTLHGHKGNIYTISFTRDGKFLASGSRDNTVKVWDLTKAEERLSVAATGVYGVAISPDGKLLAAATGSWDVANNRWDPAKPGDVKMWEVATGQELPPLRGHASWIYDLEFSSNGKLLASAGYDKTARLWDVAAHKERAVLKGHQQPLVSVTFSPDGRLLASGSGWHDKARDEIIQQSGEVKLWDVATGRELATLQGDSGPAFPVAFARNGKVLATGTKNGRIQLWDLAVDK